MSAIDFTDVFNNCAYLFSPRENELYEYAGHKDNGMIKFKSVVSNNYLLITYEELYSKTSGYKVAY